MDTEILRHRLEQIKSAAHVIEYNPNNSDDHVTKILDNVEALLAEIDQDEIDEFL